MGSEAGEPAAFEEIRDELATIAERLTEVAIEALREAVEAGETARPPLERQATRARSAVERAMAILGTPGGSGSGASGDA